MAMKVSVKGFLGRLDGAWVVAVVTACALLAAALLVPWRRGRRRGAGPETGLACQPAAVAAQPVALPEREEAAFASRVKMRIGGLVAMPDAPWLIPAVAASALLAAALFVPLWRMELVAPQYPKGLVMYAYGYKFADDSSTYYEDIREINGLNHYIGMKPIEEVTEMKLFIPGVVALVVATLAASFVAWKRRWLRALIVAGFWVMPLFFVADLQYWLYNYGHTMDPKAALDTGAFTPRVVGTTKVWNFHSETSFAVGFFFMVAAALVVTVLPPVIHWLRRRRTRAETVREVAPIREPVGQARGRVV